MASVRLTRAQHYRRPESGGAESAASASEGLSAAALLRWAGIGAAAACVGLAAAVLARRRARRAAERRRRLAPQETREEDAARADQAPGRGAPLLQGVRVVELATHLAGPLAARVLGELGAEVIKVEALEGDPLRAGLGILEHAGGVSRAQSPVFEVANLGKASICVDIRTEDGLARLRALLAEADVFIANAQLESLRKVQLDPGALLAAYPHLVYAHVSAWGAHGAGRALSGSDLGAFWAASGLAALLHKRDGLFAALPQGAGDATAAQALVTGIAMALAQRVETGRGQYVDTSLLHVGGWCVGPYASVGGPARAKACASDPLRHVYRTGDGVQMAVCGYRRRSTDSESREQAGNRALRAALGLDGPPARAASNLLAAAERRIASLTAAQVTDLLDRGDIAYKRVRDLGEVWAWASEGGEPEDLALAAVPCEERESLQRCLQPFSRDVEGMRYYVRVPFAFSCSETHGPRKAGAPAKGAHTDDVGERGWLARPEAALLPRASAAFGGTLAPPLAGCVVVELVDFGGPEPSVCVSAACRVLVERGATVLRIEPRGGDPLRTRDPRLYEQYNGGKEIVHVGNLSMEGNTELQRLLETRASIFVTDFAETELRHLDLDAASLSARCANLVVVCLHETRERETDIGTAGSLFAGTGTAHLLSGAAPSSVRMPPRHCFDLFASLHLSAALTLAYFHLKRTAEGQFVRVYLDNIGHWNLQSANSLVHWDARLTPLVELRASEYDTLFASPCCRPLQLQDGSWIQLLGVDIFEHLARTLQALQAPRSAWPRLLWCLATEVLPNRSAPTELERARPFLAMVNEILGASAAHLSLDTFRRRAAEANLWYTKVNAPEELARHPQARQNTMLETTCHGQDLRVVSPCNLLQSPRVAL